LSLDLSDKPLFGICPKPVATFRSIMAKLYSFCFSDFAKALPAILAGLAGIFPCVIVAGGGIRRR
jgi:hypothetical protein